MQTIVARLVRGSRLIAFVVLASCRTTSATPVPAAPPPAPARVEPLPLPTPVVVPVSPLRRFRESVDSMVADAQFRNAHWGILVVDPERGDTLYAHNADKLFMPASNQKIVTGAVGLTQLGADFQWRTPVELRGVQKGATFTGDLIIRGRGDPSWSDALRNGDATSALMPIVDALARRGITRIVGRITAEGDAFSDDPVGFGWAFDDFDFAYSAPVDELMLNEGFFRLIVRAGQKVAQPLQSATSPTKSYPQIHMRAVARERNDTVGLVTRVEAHWDSVAGAIEVTGTLPLGDADTINLAYRHANDAVTAAIAERLAANSIRVAAPPKRAGSTARPASPSRGARPLPPGGLVAVRAPDTLVTLVSPSLREVLKRLEKPSQNQLAEALFKTIGLQATGFGRADSARAVVQRQLVQWNVAPEAIAVRDGSGLSRHDYVAPRTLVRLLDIMRRSPSFDAFYAALPIAGVDGTIASRMKGTPAEGNVHAKTGTVDKARSLSGYVTTADGHMVVFSFLCNNFTVPNRAVERVQDAIAVQLASMRLRDAQAAGSR